MKLSFLGAAEEVTGSLHVLETQGQTLVLDCGLFQGRRRESRERNRTPPTLAIEADAVILSHAHIDHSGNLPSLVKAGYRGVIYATPATRDLCAYMLRDSARIHESDAAYLNRKYADDPNWEPIEPLYVEQDAINALERFVGQPYGRPWQVLPNVKATFIDAGHILGSAQVILDITEGDSTKRLVFSGDLGRAGLPILRDPQTPPGPIDYVIMESTYGDRLHGDIESMHTTLAKVVSETVAKKGKIVIPAFSVGRTQEVVYSLNHLRQTGRIPSVPVYVDSPLSVNATEVFKLHPECFDAETRAFMEQHGSVFDFSELRYIGSVDESIRLNTLDGSAVIISASGMCEAGRVLHHLRNTIGNPDNAVVIVGFMAQHTLGRRLVEQRPTVKIFGVERDLRARVTVIDAFSAHADRDDLLAYIEKCGAGIREVFLVHGEPDAQAPLAATLRDRGHKITVPARGTRVELGTGRGE